MSDKLPRLIVVLDKAKVGSGSEWPASHIRVPVNERKWS